MPRGRTSTKVTSTPLKRALSPAVKTLTPPSRQSKRLKSSPAAASNGKRTPKKSKYFPRDPSDEEEEPKEMEEEASGYEDEDDEAFASSLSEPPESESSVEEDEESEEEYTKSKRKRKSASKKVTPKANGNGVIKAAAKAIVEKGKELWREGIKTDLAPGEEVFIKLPKARGDGGVKYEDGVVHPNTMLFLGDLGRNNEREWLKMHDADYRQSKKNWDAFVEKMTDAIIEKDETIPELPPKDLTFRIYRDVRFSSDPTPYKAHYSAAWSRTGRKGPYAGYYLQIKPSGSFIGGGLWCPEAAPLALLRANVDRRSRDLKDVLLAPEMRKEFLGGCKADDKSVVKAFVEKNGENALKTKPKVSFIFQSYHPTRV